MTRTPERLTHDFYTHYDTVDLARALLGKKLVTLSRGVRTSGVIVEVEGYLGKDDPACHAARGMTPRNRVMFASPGHCYVYRIYGMSHCVNVVSDPEGFGSAVLIRAIEPIEGIDVMKRRRAGRVVRDLARGPGRRCQAMGIRTSYSGEHFSESSRIWIEPHREIPHREIATSGRIGISSGSDLPLRFYLKDSPSASGSSRSLRTKDSDDGED